MKTPRHKTIVAVLLLSCLLICTLTELVWNHKSSHQRLDRESYSVSIHMAMLTALSDNDARPLNAILKDYGPGLLKPFPDGLLYHSDGSSFTLAEPSSRPISFFRKDRLVVTDQESPRLRGAMTLTFVKNHEESFGNYSIIGIDLCPL